MSYVTYTSNAVPYVDEWTYRRAPSFPDVTDVESFIRESIRAAKQGACPICRSQFVKMMSRSVRRCDACAISYDMMNKFQIRRMLTEMMIRDVHES